MRTNMIARRVLTLIVITISALMQAYAIMACIKPAGLIASGFTGLALLIEKMTALTHVFTLPTQIGMILLNIPVGLLCWRVISRHFVIMSIIQVLLTTLFMTVIPFQPLFNDRIILTIVAGCLYGGGIAVALRAGACTMGTDLISMYVASRKGAPIWGWILIGNIMMYVIFGFMFGWLPACYTACFQYVSTVIIQKYYNRYDKYELTITTRGKNAPVLMEALSGFHHSISIINDENAGMNEATDMLKDDDNQIEPNHTDRTDAITVNDDDSHKILRMVCSSYEIRSIIYAVNTVSKEARITVIKLDDYHGLFYSAPVDEPVIINVSMNDGVSRIG